MNDWLNSQRWRTSIAFRTAAWAAGLFALAGLLLVATLYLAITAEVTTSAKERLVTDAAILSAAWDKAEPIARATAIARAYGSVAHAAPGPAGPLTFAVFDSTGGHMLGQVSIDQPFSGSRTWSISETVRDEIRDANDYDPVVGLGVAIDGGTLVVARSLPWLGEVQEAILRVLGLGLLGVLVLSLLLGWLLSRSAIRRVDQIAAITSRVGQGESNARLPILGTGDDIDRLSANVNSMLDKTSDLMAAMKRVTGDIAHDMKAPLSRLRQRLEPLAQDLSAHEAGGQIAAAVGEVDEVIATFNAMLRIVEIEAGSRRQAFAPVDLAEVLRDIGGLHAAGAEERGQKLTLLGSAATMVIGDRRLLRQMISNLIENAVKHAPAGSTIQCQLSQTASGSALCQIADNGPGIPASAREKVLRPFFRLQESRTTPGQGLGLALVKAIADLHGAQLTLTDNGPGLCVRVEFQASPKDN